jgi:16S rRNA (guanine966-N2)-methyltransferase
MRIISGVSKGKLLFSPPDKVRPTSDRAREGLFSSLISEFGSMSKLSFLDLFAGSGAVGVEALSRGVAIVHAVEKDATVAEVATRNFALVKKPVGSYQVFRASAATFIESCSGIQYDAIFMDPPYDLSNESVEAMLVAIQSKNLLNPSGLICIERASKVNPFNWPAGFVLAKVRSYGQGSIFYGGYSASVLL